jgi:hypothetical protein
MATTERSGLFEAARRICDPTRKCPVAGCTEPVEFGDFACGPEHEDVIAGEIARAVAPLAAKEGK